MTKLTAKKPFIANLGGSGNVSAACAAAGISRQTAYQWRDSDPVFAAEWDAKLEEGLDELEREAQRRAKESSDTLLIFLLKSKRRSVFGDQSKVEHSGQVGLITLGDVGREVVA